MYARYRFICLILLLSSFSGSLFSQKYLFDADSCTATGFPTVKGRIYHRGYGETVLKKEQLIIREDGKPVEFIFSVTASKKKPAQNKRVLLLIENHYQPKGVSQRNFFANVISLGIYNKVMPGDKFMIATFDWQRNGRYIFPAFEKFTDDTAVLRNALRALKAPPVLHNLQEGADINSSLDEALKYLSPANDSLPTAIFLFSDDLDNSVGRIVNADIRNKALESAIPIYAVSYTMYSRYNAVMRDEICGPTFGRYFISPANNIDDAALRLKDFLDKMIGDYQGTTFDFSYTSASVKDGQKLALDFAIKNSSLLDVETVEVPAPGFAEKLSRNMLTTALAIAVLLLVVALLIIYFRKNKTKRRQQEQLIRQTRDELSSQTELMEKEKAVTNERLLNMQQLQADNERAKLLAEKKKEEDRLVQLMMAHGAFPTLLYSYEDISGKVDLSSPVFDIGREKSNHLYIQLDTVSRKHATIYFDESGTYTIIDQNSSNGTFVNGQKIKQAVLKSDDLIQIGGFNLIFHY